MVKKEQSATPINPPASFETAMSELETIVNAMERDDLPLEQALAHYQRGIDLLNHCQNTLANAEQRIRILEQGVLRELTDKSNGSES